MYRSFSSSRGSSLIWRHVDTLFRTTCSLVATWMLCWMSFAFVVWTCVVDIIPMHFPDIRAIGLSCPYMEYCPPLHITYLILGILLGHITYRQLGDVKLISLSATAWGRVVDLSCLTCLAAQYSPPHMPLRFSDPTSALLADLALRPVLILGFSVFALALSQGRGIVSSLFDSALLQDLGQLAWPVYLLHRPVIISSLWLVSAGLGEPPSGMFLYVFWVGLFYIVLLIARVAQSLQEILFSVQNCCPRTTKAML